MSTIAARVSVGSNSGFGLVSNFPAGREFAGNSSRTIRIRDITTVSVQGKHTWQLAFDAIEGKLRKRAAWVTRQQRYFSQFLPRTPERRFVAGETHLYLGRQYRLKVVPHVQESVKLIRGFIVVQTHPERSDAASKACANSRPLRLFRT